MLFIVVRYVRMRCSLKKTILQNVTQNAMRVSNKRNKIQIFNG